MEYKHRVNNTAIKYNGGLLKVLKCGSKFISYMKISLMTCFMLLYENHILRGNLEREPWKRKVWTDNLLESEPY